MGAKHESEITDTTRVPLRMVFGAIAVTGVVVGLWWSLKSDLSELRKQARKQWSIENQENWTLRLQNSNPNLKVPDARDSWHQNGTEGASEGRSGKGEGRAS